MSEKEDGGPAGMSLRDWIAGQALAGISANPTTRKPDNPEADMMTIEQAFARAAYSLADAMLKERTLGR